jgi:hypothetical protein
MLNEVGNIRERRIYKNQEERCADRNLRYGPHVCIWRLRPLFEASTRTASCYNTEGRGFDSR